MIKQFEIAGPNDITDNMSNLLQNTIKDYTNETSDMIIKLTVKNRLKWEEDAESLLNTENKNFIELLNEGNLYSEYEENIIEDISLINNIFAVDASKVYLLEAITTDNFDLIKDNDKDLATSIIEMVKFLYIIKYRYNKIIEAMDNKYPKDIRESSKFINSQYIELYEKSLRSMKDENPTDKKAIKNLEEIIEIYKNKSNHQLIIEQFQDSPYLRKIIKRNSKIEDIKNTLEYLCIEKKLYSENFIKKIYDYIINMLEIKNDSVKVFSNILIVFITSRIRDYHNNSKGMHYSRLLQDMQSDINGFLDYDDFTREDILNTLKKLYEVFINIYNNNVSKYNIRRK